MKIEDKLKEGYRSSPAYDPLKASYFEERSKDSAPIRVYPSVDSTNEQLKNWARQGAVHGSTILADRQSAGKGRMGRSFYSPALTGLYLSVLLKPDPSFQIDLKITLKVAVLAARSLEKYGSATIGLKWVNDLYTTQGKVGGILTEALSLEGGSIDTVIVGIGINLLPPTDGFPKDIAARAAAVFEPDSYRPIKNSLALDLITAYKGLLSKDEDNDLLSEYRERSVILGKEVVAKMGDKEIAGTALAIEDNGALVLKKFDGQLEYLLSAEVSIKGDFSS